MNNDEHVNDTFDNEEKDVVETTTLDGNRNVFDEGPYPSDSSEVNEDGDDIEENETVNVTEKIETIEKRLENMDMINHMLNNIKSELEKLSKNSNEKTLKTDLKVQKNVKKNYNKRSWFGKVLKVATSILCVSIAIEFFNMRNNYEETETCT